MASLCPIALANWTIRNSLHGGLKPREKGWLVTWRILRRRVRPTEAVMLLVIRKQLVVSRKKCILKTAISDLRPRFLLLWERWIQKTRQGRSPAQSWPLAHSVQGIWVATSEGSQLHERINFIKSTISSKVPKGQRKTTESLAEPLWQSSYQYRVLRKEFVTGVDKERNGSNTWQCKYMKMEKVCINMSHVLQQSVIGFFFLQFQDICGLRISHLFFTGQILFLTGTTVGTQICIFCLTFTSKRFFYFKVAFFFFFLTLPAFWIPMFWSSRSI